MGSGMSDLERAIAVIADLCGAGRPGVKESAEELADCDEDGFFSNCPIGRGATEAEAIADLLAQIEDAA